MLGMASAPAWMVYEPLSSYQLLMIGGALLILAAVLMGLRRKTRITLENSGVTQELMIYLARIADALERPQGPSAEQITGEVLRRLQESNDAKPEASVRQIPNSMFGREY
jgi:hypothetical protein